MSNVNMRLVTMNFTFVLSVNFVAIFVPNLSTVARVYNVDRDKRARIST
jgi:hypothetical protein